MTLRIGMVGAGWHATADHGPALRLHAEREEFKGQVELTGVFDLDRDRATVSAKEFGFRSVFGSIDELAKNVDAILLIVPPAVMLEALRSILPFNRPMLIEKPLGTSLRESEQIVDLLQGRWHMVSLNRRFDPAVVMGQRWMSEQSPPRQIRGVMARVDRREADFIWSTGIHLTDLMLHLAPDLRGQAEFLPTAGRMEESVAITGDDWSVRIETGSPHPWRLRCERDGKVERDLFDPHPDSPACTRNGTSAETCAFLRAILKRRPLAPTAADAMPGTRWAAELSR